MSVNIPSWYVQQYSTNIDLLLQQKGSKLSSAVSMGSYVGTQASPVDQVGSIEANTVTSRFADMPRIDAALSRRWVTPTDYDVPQLIDSFDKLRLLTDPGSRYVENAVYALGRKKDTAIINAFTDAAKTGVAGAGSTIFTAANEVDVSTGGANSRLNVAKIKAVKELMRANFVDFDNDPVYIGLTAKDESSLLEDIQMVSSDFNQRDTPVLQDGKLTRFLGMNFIYCELIESVAAGTNEVDVPVWAKSGMHLGVWNEIQASITVRNDIQSEPWQAYVKMTCGATRLEEDKVYNIESYRA